MARASEQGGRKPKNGFPWGFDPGLPARGRTVYEDGSRTQKVPKRGEVGLSNARGSWAAQEDAVAKVVRANRAKARKRKAK